MTDGYPFEIWQYKHLNGLGDDVALEFVDDCICGDYRLVRSSDSIAALLTKEP